jgi:hypothetical protein
MTDADVLAALDDQQTLALTAYAEARAIVLLLNRQGQVASHSPIEELVAVMCAVRNRRGHPARWDSVDGSFKSLCLAHAQFSCWTPNSGTNHDALMAQAQVLVGVSGTALIDPELRECLYLAQGVMMGEIRDRTGGATSYYSPAAMVPVGRVPMWALHKPFTLIGNQRFLTL